MKQPYLTSITRNSNQLTNLRSTVLSFYSPLFINAPFYGYLMLLLSYTERKEVETKMRDPGLHPLTLMLFKSFVNRNTAWQKAKIWIKDWGVKSKIKFVKKRERGLLRVKIQKKNSGRACPRTPLETFSLFWKPVIIYPPLRILSSV